MLKLQHIQTYLVCTLLFQALGGNERWFDRFLAQHIAVFYYFMTASMYILSPRMACK
jgi:ubiquinol oxidase